MNTQKIFALLTTATLSSAMLLSAPSEVSASKIINNKLVDEKISSYKKFSSPYSYSIQSDDSTETTGLLSDEKTPCECSLTPTEELKEIFKCNSVIMPPDSINDICTLINEKDAAFEKITYNGNTILLWAINNNHIDLAIKIVGKASLDFLNKTFDSKSTPLIASAQKYTQCTQDSEEQKKWNELIRALIKKGANIKATDSNGKSFATLSKDNPELKRILKESKQGCSCTIL